MWNVVVGGQYDAAARVRCDGGVVCDFVLIIKLNRKKMLDLRS